MIKEKRGGKRKGSGRKKKEPTETVSFRVKCTLSDALKIHVHKFIKNINENPHRLRRITNSL